MDTASSERSAGSPVPGLYLRRPRLSFSGSAPAAV